MLKKVITLQVTSKVSKLHLSRLSLQSLLLSHSSTSLYTALPRLVNYLYQPIASNLIPPSSLLFTLHLKTGLNVIYSILLGVERFEVFEPRL